MCHCLNMSTWKIKLMPNKSQQKDLMEEAKLKRMSGYGRLTFLTENVLFENCPRDLPRITFVVS